MKNNPYIHLLLASWENARERRPMLLLSIACFVVANSIILLQPFIFAQVLNTIQIGGEGLWEWFVTYMILYSLIPFLFWVFHGIGRVIERTVAFHITRNLKDRLFDMVTKLPFSWHTDHHSGETVDKVSKSTSALERFSDSHFSYIETMVRFVGSLIGVTFVAWYLGVGAILIATCIISAILAFDKRLIVQYRDILKREHAIAALLFDYISNIRTVITLHFESLARHELSKKILDIFPYRKKNYVYNELKWFSVSMLVAATMFATILIYGYTSLQTTGTILVGNLVMIYQYLEKFSGSFYNFAWFYENIVKLDTEFRTADTIVSDYEKLYTVKEHNRIGEWSELSLEGVEFGYRNDSKTLQNISLRIRKGERIAFIGESGSGKSTLLSLLKGLYEPRAGKLRVDGVVSTDFEPLKGITTLIPQDPEIFENTLVYNITFWIETDQEAVHTPVRLARFDSVVKRLPKGLDTDIKEKGVNLSGGEKQRLALARGLFIARWSDIILLDEPTSSVDPTNEKIIYESIFAEYPDKSIISSIHKLYLLPLFDTIYLFETGEVKEFGSFDELLSRDSAFSRIWREYQEQEVRQEA